MIRIGGTLLGAGLLTDDGPEPTSFSRCAATLTTATSRISPARSVNQPRPPSGARRRRVVLILAICRWYRELTDVVPARHSLEERTRQPYWRRCPRAPARGRRLGGG